jgi:hypothetical protein
VDQFSEVIETVALGRRTLAQAVRELEGGPGTAGLN